jgi:hypothetical protein
MAVFGSFFAFFAYFVVERAVFLTGLTGFFQDLQDWGIPPFQRSSIPSFHFEGSSRTAIFDRINRIYRIVDFIRGIRVIRS